MNSGMLRHSIMQGSSSVEMIRIDNYAKEHFEKAVKKTLTIPAWLNKAAIERNLNFSRILQEALIEKIKDK